MTEIPQFTLPKPPDYIFTNEFWVFKLQRFGLPPDNAQQTARHIAKECYLMPTDIRGRWLRENFNDEKSKALAALFK